MNKETTRLLLTPITAVNFEEVYQMFTNEFIRKYLFDDEKISEEQVQAFIQESLQLFVRKKYGLWLIYLKETNQMIGFTGLWHFFNETQPQLLYALLPAYTGLGYAKEAAAEVIKHAFNHLRFSYLDAACDAPNQASHNLALALGMRKLREDRMDGRPITFYRIEKTWGKG